LKYLSKITLIALTGICIWSCSRKSDDENPVYKDAGLSIEERVDDLLDRMTLEEKFGQMFMIAGDLSIGKDKLKHGVFGFQISSKGKNDNAAEQIMDLATLPLNMIIWNSVKTISLTMKPFKSHVQ